MAQDDHKVDPIMAATELAATPGGEEPRRRDEATTASFPWCSPTPDACNTTFGPQRSDYQVAKGPFSSGSSAGSEHPVALGPFSSGSNARSKDADRLSGARLTSSPSPAGLRGSGERTHSERPDDADDDHRDTGRRRPAADSWRRQGRCAVLVTGPLRPGFFAARVL